MFFITRVFALVARTSGGVSSLCHYFAASTLKLEDIKQGIRHSWQGFNSRDTDIAAGLMTWEEDLVQRFVAPGAAVLIVGCGSGRDLLALAERGYQVTGVDPASIALRIAERALRQRQLSAHLIEGFVEDVRLSGQFDVVFFSYHSYSYIPESARRVRALRAAAAHLTAGGHILISYEAMTRPPPVMIRLARIVGMLCGSDWRLEPGDRVFPKHFREQRYYSYAHAFQPEELEKESAAAGLRVVYRRELPHDPVIALMQL